MTYGYSEHCILKCSIWTVSFWMSVPHGDVPWTSPQHCTEIQTRGHGETSEEKLCVKDCGVTEWLTVKFLALKKLSENFCHNVLYLTNKMSHLNKFLKGPWMSSHRNILSWEPNFLWYLLQSLFWTLNSFGVHGRLTASSDSFSVNVLTGEMVFGHMSNDRLCLCSPFLPCLLPSSCLWCQKSSEVRLF